MLTRTLVCVTMLCGFAFQTAADAKQQFGSQLSLRQLYHLHRLPKVGTCYRSRITHVTSRFGGTPSRDDGTVVLFKSGLQQVSYGIVEAVLRSRPGDSVTSCVVSLPKDCPPGDTRGIYYRTHDWRTRESWTLPDSQHECGGA